MADLEKKPKSLSEARLIAGLRRTRLFDTQLGISNSDTAAEMKMMDTLALPTPLLGSGSPSPLSLPTPLVVHSEDGEAFTLSGVLKPCRQEKHTIEIKRFVNNEVVARVHVAENDDSCGMMMEFVSSDGTTTPFAFLDTRFAFGGDESMPVDRQVNVYGIADGLHPTALPSAIIMDDKDDDWFGQNDFLLLQCNNTGDVRTDEVVFRCLANEHDSAKLSHVEDQQGSLLAMLHYALYDHPMVVQCTCGVDAGLLLAGVVSSMRLL